MGVTHYVALGDLQTDGKSVLCNNDVFQYVRRTNWIKTQNRLYIIVPSSNNTWKASFWLVPG